jgi:HTH-type transcriptional regulator / antitoxin HigA
MQPLFEQSMEIKPIKSESDYQQALLRVEEIFLAKPNTKEGDELEILAILIEHYEEEHFPVDMPEPIEAIRFRMDQMGMDQQDLTRIIGSKSRASEILNRKRPLSIRQIRLLQKALHIPADVLLKEY